MDSKHSDDDYIINDTEYEEDEADIAFDKQEKSKKKGSAHSPAPITPSSSPPIAIKQTVREKITLFG